MRFSNEPTRRSPRGLAASAEHEHAGVVAGNAAGGGEQEAGATEIPGTRVVEQTLQHIGGYPSSGRCGLRGTAEGAGDVEMVDDHLEHACGGVLLKFPPAGASRCGLSVMLKAMTTRTLETVIAGALLGTFAGDALGREWEGAPAVSAAKGRDRLRRSLRSDQLVYTDDTQLALALAEHLCAHPQVKPALLAETFVEHYESWRGYGAGMHGLVEEWRRGASVDEAATAIFPDGSFGNGAAMRVAPVGALWADEPATLDEVARRQAGVTHAHRLGLDAAAVQAQAVGLAARHGDFGRAELTELGAVAREPELRERLQEAEELAAAWASDGPPGLPRVAEQLGHDVTGPGSVPAACWIAAVGDDLEEAMALALGLGGDADTIAAMAGAVLGAAATRVGIPESWSARFENGPGGRDYALDLVSRLAASRSGG